MRYQQNAPVWILHLNSNPILLSDCNHPSSDMPQLHLHLAGSQIQIFQEHCSMSKWLGYQVGRVRLFPPRVEQYSQLHKEKAKGLFWTLAIPKRFRWIHVFSFWCHDLEILLLFPPFPMEEHPWFPSLPSWSGKSCWIRWRPKSQSLPMGPTPVSGGKVEFVSMEAT